METETQPALGLALAALLMHCPCADADKELEELQVARDDIEDNGNGEAAGV